MSKEIKLTQGKVAIVDDEWFDMLSLVNWHLVELCSQERKKWCRKNAPPYHESTERNAG